MRHCLVLILAFACLAWPSVGAAQQGDTVDPTTQCVVLLHGLARTRKAMKPVAQYLDAAGYIVQNIGYRSRHSTIEVLAEDAVSRGIEQCRQANSRIIHFVTHSMGGILVRYYLSAQPLPELGRVVMMAPPNQGSEVVDDWRDRPGFRALNGPAGMQLGTDPDSVPAQLGAVDFSLGVIAGTATINPILSRSLPDPDDGKVSVSATKVEGMDDFIAVPFSHTFLMKEHKVQAQILAFLRNGAFTTL